MADGSDVRFNETPSKLSLRNSWIARFATCAKRRAGIYNHQNSVSQVGNVPGIRNGDEPAAYQ